MGRKKTETQLAELQVAATPDEPIDFGYESSWIAVQAADEAVVSEVLGLRDVVACNWESGLEAAGRCPERFVFVTPRVEGWVLAVGGGLPDPDDLRSTQWAKLMRKMSREFGSAHFFATYRAFSYTLWARYVDGRETRIFLCDDDHISTRGEPTPEELDLTESFDLADRFPEEKDVITMADRWSISPMELEALGLRASVGLLGR